MLGIRTIRGKMGWLACSVVLLSLCACHKDYEELQLFKVYEVSLPDASGVAIFSETGLDGRSQGVFYRDTGALYADTARVSVVWRKGEARMKFPDGSSVPFTYRLYEAPPFEDQPSVRTWRQRLLDQLPAAGEPAFLKNLF